MGIAKKFVTGILMTLVLVLVVPIVSDVYIVPYLTRLIGESALIQIGSTTLISLVGYGVVLGFTLLLGGGAVFRYCGVFGIVGLVFAYYLLGDVSAAIPPIVSLVLVYVILWNFKLKKKKKAKANKS